MKHFIQSIIEKHVNFKNLKKIDNIHIYVVLMILIEYF